MNRWERPVSARARGGAPLLVLLVLLAHAVAPPPAHGQALRSQTVRLAAGWNAVYLEVDPLVADPAELLGRVGVDTIAAYDPPYGTAQFVSTPEAGMLQSFGWAVWYAPQRPDAFLSRLRRLNGATAYLIHAPTNVLLQVAGRVPPFRRQWLPDAFNFVGFSVQDPGGPTFRQFFAASPSHNHNRIYRLANGTWRQVLDPSAETVRSGEAFWIYCEGRSEYAGPLEVVPPSFSGLTLTPLGGGELIFRNRTDHPVSFEVQHLPAGNAAIPFAAAVRTVDEQAGGFRTVTVRLGAGAWVQSFPPLEAGQGLRLPLDLIPDQAPPGVSHSLLRVRSDLGTDTYVSVTAGRDDLPAVP